MDISYSSVMRFVRFLDEIEQETYPEWPTKFHSQITDQALNYLLDNYSIPPNARILDVGCGQGPALDMFREKGFQPLGITLNDVDVQVCRQKKHEVMKMDQSFLEFDGEMFDIVWARHVIEHSIFPYFTLSEYYRVMKKGGYLYLEVPSPETSCRSEMHPNHYSVLGYTMWLSLLARTGFETREAKKYALKTDNGPEEYWCFYNIK